MADEGMIEFEEVEIKGLDEQMYATGAVNLRDFYSIAVEKVRTLSTGEQVHVTGVTIDDQWYRGYQTMEQMFT